MEPTIEQLKSHAYDCLANIEMWQKELQATNMKINQIVSQMPKEEKEEDKKHS